MNLLKNNGWKCLWRGHPAQPTDQLKPPLTTRNGMPRHGVIVTQWTPDKHHQHIVKNATHLDPVTLPAVKGVTGTVHQDVMPSWHGVLWLGRGVERTVGLANKDMMDAIVNPMEPGVAPTCEFHPALLSRSSPHIALLPVGEGQVIFWRGSYQLDFRKTAPTDAYATICFALGGVTPPTPPLNNIAAHQRCPRLKAPAARKIGAVVYHMLVCRARMPLGCTLGCVRTLHAIFAQISHNHHF